MYQSIYLKPTGGGKYSVHLWDDTKGYTNFEWSKSAFVPDQYGEYTSLDGTKCKKTHYFFDSDIKYESDVPSDTKLLVELYSDTDEPATWQNMFYFDIEVSMEGQLPDPKEGNNPITSIAYYDEPTDRYGVFILDEEGELSNHKEEKYDLIVCESEQELLSKFLNQWQASAPTIVTGWNIDFFDVPYLYNRIKRVLGNTEANRLSPVGIIDWNERKERYFIAGVNCLDYLPIYKKFTFTQLSSYRLDAVGEYELGWGKVEYEGTLDQLKKTDIKKFIEYNVVDVKLVVEFEKKLKFIEQAIGITSVGHVPYENIYQSSKFLEGSILTYLTSDW
jgi:DNA polymerase elongation subunit (family B)